METCLTAFKKYICAVIKTDHLHVDKVRKEMWLKCDIFGNIAPVLFSDLLILRSCDFKDLPTSIHCSFLFLGLVSLIISKRNTKRLAKAMFVF